MEEFLSMKKKILLISLTLLLTVGLLAIGCPAPAPAPAPAPTPAPAPAPPAPEVKPITWTIQGFVPAGLFFHDNLLHFADSLKEMSGGRLVLDVHPAPAIVPSLESLDAVAEGVLDAKYTHTGMWIGKAEVAPLFCSTPGVFDTLDRMMWVYEGGGAELAEEFYRELLGLDVHHIMVGTISMEILMWSNTPLRTLDDFKGKKFRMMPLMGKVLDANGLSTVFLPGAEIIPALERGVIDCAEYSVPAFDIRAGYPDVCKYYHYPGIHQPSSCTHLVINGEKWRALPDDLKAILEYVCECETFWTWHNGDRLNIEALAEFDRMGNEMVILEPETVGTLLEWADAYLDAEAAKDPFFAKVWNSQKEWRGEWYPYAEAISFSRAERWYAR